MEKRREYIDFRLPKSEWNARTRKLLDIYRKSYQVFEETFKTLRVRIYDIAPVYPLNSNSKLIGVESSDHMVLMATMNDINTLEVGCFAIEKQYDDKKYESGRVMFIKNSDLLDDWHQERYRPIYPIRDCIREFYIRNEALVKEVYDDLVSGELKIDIKGKGIPCPEKIKVFLSVPISGLDINTVKKNANYVKSSIYQLVKSPNIEVLTPFEICDGKIDEPYSWFMGRDIEALLECDTIVSLPGWEASKGCRCERATAEIYGLRVYEAKDLLSFLDTDAVYQLLANGDVRKCKILDRSLSGEKVSRVLHDKDIDTVNTDGSVEPLWDGCDNSFQLGALELFAKNMDHCRYFVSEEAARKAFEEEPKPWNQPPKRYNIYALSLKDNSKVEIIERNQTVDDVAEFWKRTKRFERGYFYFPHLVGVEQPETSFD